MGSVLANVGKSHGDGSFMVLPKDCHEIYMGRWGEKKFICAKWNEASFLHASLFVTSIMTYECAIFRTYTITQLKSVLGEDSPVLAVPAARVLLSWGSVPCGHAQLQQLWVHSLSCVNCLHVALKSETNEGEHRWAYDLDRILAKKVCNVFLNHCSSCFCISLSWHIKKMLPGRSALLVACSLHCHTKGADGRFLQVEELFCAHLRGDGVTGGSNFLVVCSLTLDSNDVFSFFSFKIHYAVPLFQNECKIPLME